MAVVVVVRAQTAGAVAVRADSRALATTDAYDIVRAGSPGHSSGYGGANRLGSTASRFSADVGVALRRGGDPVTQQSANQGQADAGTDADARMGVPQRVQRDALETSMLHHLAPWA